jgi:carbonic anhydrase/acetyltransferase-like protein (isoleucine patch superfamily)
MFRRTKMMGAVFAALTLAALAGFRSSATGPDTNFVDPTASKEGKVNLQGQHIYVAPFARLKGPTEGEGLTILDDSNVQDGATVDATQGTVEIGRKAILAHGSTVRGVGAHTTQIGMSGTCPLGTECPSFVGFNAEVDGAMIQKDAMVSAMARVAPGLTIKSGVKVQPGKCICNAGDLDPAKEKVVDVTGEDRTFMNGTVESNVKLAAGYLGLGKDVTGINYDPTKHELPRLGPTPVQDLAYANRLVGLLSMQDTLEDLQKVLESRISLRSDEGHSIRVRKILRMGHGAIFHAGKHNMELGSGIRYGKHSIVHGGVATSGKDTSVGNGVVIGNYAVIFGSTIGADCKIGERSLVQDSDLKAGTEIPARKVVIDGRIVWDVEW